MSDHVILPTPSGAAAGQRHTPGPWRVMGDGVTVAQDRKQHRTHVCRAFEIYGVRSERAANARLIAASPTMAAYIKIHADRGDHEAQAIMEAINAAR